jgi:hypothetical protein
LQAWQAVAQLAVVQQAPSTQLLLLHSPTRAQVWPLAFLAEHAVPLQKNPDAQSASPTQVVRHAAVPLQANPPHGIGVAAGRQTPRPSHVRAGVSAGLVPPHTWAAHCVPVANLRQAPRPSQNPSLAQVAAPWFWQPPCGSRAPFATGLQVPRVAVRLHDWHVPLQAVLQQTPCAQTPDMHSLPTAHARPLTLSAHAPLVHKAGDAQSALLAQVFLQTPVPQRNGKHDVAPGVVHRPAPSHVDVGVNAVVAAGQVESLQAVPLTNLWQAPASQRPLFAQVAAPWFTQIPVGSGSPVGTFVHVPNVPLRAQDWQLAVQAELQHTPCAQKLLRHSLPFEHEAPGLFLPHALTMHEFGARHCAFAVHALKHLVPLQTYGLQPMAAGAAHAPAVVHVDGGVYTFELHVSGAQRVPTAYFWQPPLPSHRPFVAQAGAPPSVQIARGSVAPTAMFVHLPSVAASAQLRQAPAQSVSQHTLSTQKLDRHSVLAAHGCPGSLAPHRPFTHAWPVSQSAFVVQRVVHIPPAQRKGLQA